MSFPNGDLNITQVDPRDLVKLACLLGESLAVLDRGYFSSVISNLQDALALAEELHGIAYGHSDAAPLFDIESETGTPMA